MTLILKLKKKILSQQSISLQFSVKCFHTTTQNFKHTIGQQQLFYYYIVYIFINSIPDFKKN